MLSIIPDAAKSKALKLKGMLLFLERNCSNIKRNCSFCQSIMPCRQRCSKFV
ncbi:hypothetical protein FC25_GL001199 [Ligilactobacillus ruminis DSM 20403 = NBRC 102161]|nr:hypothetical protein FC25_GL001199 [Ligilactobacillus ruminis DSM 20403 = NBRC 102161]